MVQSSISEHPVIQGLSSTCLKEYKNFSHSSHSVLQLAHCALGSQYLSAPALKKKICRSFLVDLYISSAVSLAPMLMILLKSQSIYVYDHMRLFAARTAPYMRSHADSLGTDKRQIYNLQDGDDYSCD